MTSLVWVSRRIALGEPLFEYSHTDTHSHTPHSSKERLYICRIVRAPNRITIFFYKNKVETKDTHTHTHAPDNFLCFTTRARVTHKTHTHARNLRVCVIASLAIITNLADGVGGLLVRMCEERTCDDVCGYPKWWYSLFVVSFYYIIRGKATGTGRLLMCV